MNVNFTRIAQGDLRAIHSYILRSNERAADRVVSRIRQAAVMLERFPMIGPEGDIEGTREFHVSGLPYTIVYRITSQTEVDVLTIVHDRMRWPPE